MMKPHRLFRCLTNDEVDDIVLSACEDDDLPDKIAGGVLTYQNLTLKRFAKLAEETRKSYVRRTLRDRRADDLALFVLSAALTRAKADLVSAFLDALGLPHEGPHLSYEGEIPEPGKTVIDDAVGALLGKFPERDVALYLNAFAAQPDVHWKGLDALLAGDPRLKLIENGEPGASRLGTLGS